MHPINLCGIAREATPPPLASLLYGRIKPILIDTYYYATYVRHIINNSRPARSTPMNHCHANTTTGHHLLGRFGLARRKGGDQRQPNASIEEARLRRDARSGDAAHQRGWWLLGQGAGR